MNKKLKKNISFYVSINEYTTKLKLNHNNNNKNNSSK